MTTLSYIPSTPDWFPAETTALRSEINTLIRIGAVAACEPCDGQFISRIFLVPKADGSSRFILNLKPLNRFVVTHHFKMEDRMTVMRLLSRHCYMATTICILFDSSRAVLSKVFAFAFPKWTFLGFVFNSISMTISLPPDKR